MDVQKISEAAATIKKVEQAVGWFNRFPNELPVENIIIETTGNSTAVAGHGEAKYYIRAAFTVFRGQVMDLAVRLAEQDKVRAEEEIKQEASGV